MKRIIYLARYRFHLWWKGLPVGVALNYPPPYLTSDNDPIEDADTELEYMAEG